MVGLLLQGGGVGFLLLDFKVSWLVLEWVCRAEVLVSPSHLQGLRKISAYMKTMSKTMHGVPVLVGKIYQCACHREH